MVRYKWCGIQEVILSKNVNITFALYPTFAEQFQGTHRET
jgi:hypothetical protein